MLTGAVAADITGASDLVPMLPRAEQQGAADCADLTLALPAGRRRPVLPPLRARANCAIMPEQVADMRATFNLT